MIFGMNNYFKKTLHKIWQINYKTLILQKITHNMTYLISSILLYKLYWSIQKLEKPKKRSTKFYRTR